MRSICCECKILFDVKEPFDQDDETHGVCPDCFAIAMHNLGYCECGCGEKTPLASQTDYARGWIKGQPIRFINHHQNKTISRYAKRSINHYSKSKMGSKNPRWKGKHVQPQAGRERAKSRYTLTTCENCGAHATDRHHINGNTLNNKRSNIKLLCRKCHMEMDGRLNNLRIRMKNVSE